MKRGRWYCADGVSRTSSVLRERNTGEVNVVRMRVLGSALDSNIRDANRHRQRIDAVERVHQLREIHVGQLQLHAELGESVAELAIGAGGDRADLVAPDTLGHRGFDHGEQQKIFPRNRALLSLGEISLELRVGAGEPANLDEVVLSLCDLVLETRAQIHDWRVNQVVDEKNCEQAARDLYQDAFARFELLVAAAALRD